jgi:hypothetical protein
MEFKELLQGFGDRYDIEDMVAEGDESVALKIDDMVLELVHDSIGQNIFLRGTFGAPPLEGELLFAQMLLKTNYLQLGTDKPMVAQNPETNAYVLNRAISLRGLDLDTFCSNVEHFVNQLEDWVKLLADYRPAMEEMKSRESEEKKVTSLNSGDFIRV